MSFVTQAITLPDPGLPDAPQGEPPADDSTGRGLSVRHGLWKYARPPVEVSPDEAMADLERIGWQHLTSGKTHLLALAAAAGLGKSTLAVKLAERAASAGRRVLYLGPRHNFFPDVIALASKPHWWYEWESTQPRDDQPLQMCKYPKEIHMWQTRGYQSIDFCSNHRVCGWDFVKAGVSHVAGGGNLVDCGGCRYHAQQGMQQRIIYGQHQHLTLGHPLLEQIDVIIGDENPMNAVLHQWLIPAKHVKPEGMDLSDPFTEIVDRLQTLALDKDTRLQGPDLLEALGGALEVLVACEAWNTRLDVEALEPTLRFPGEVETIPYFHLIELGRLLYREACQAVQELTYPHRVIVTGGNLMLLLRRYVNEHARGKPILWLDATASKHIYEAVFNPIPVQVVQPNVKRVGRIFQMIQRTNNKHSFADENRAVNVNQTIDLIMERHNYVKPAIISYKVIVDSLGKSEWLRAHFGGARGTNRLEGCDVLFVVGTPLPDIGDIDKTARMLWFERMEAFTPTWSEQPVTYDCAGTWNGSKFTVGVGVDGAAMRVNGFWHDEDLQALLWQYREAELNQAANRARPLRRQVDVWVLSSVPFGIAPDALVSIHELHNVPEGVAKHRLTQWSDVIAFAQERVAENGCVTATDLVKRFGISPTTAGRYIDLLITALDWTSEPAARPKGRGRPGKQAGPKVA